MFNQEELVTEIQNFLNFYAYPHRAAKSDEHQTDIKTLADIRSTLLWVLRNMTARKTTRQSFQAEIVDRRSTKASRNES